MFKATRKTCYEEVLPLPRLGDVAERLQRGRVLAIVSPDSRVPPEEVQRFFEGLSRKNNLCVLTGDKTSMASVEKAARQLYAAQKANDRIPEGHLQRPELEAKQARLRAGLQRHRPRTLRQGALPDTAPRQGSAARAQAP